MFVLGIDPGLTITGYGLVSGGAQTRAAAAGVIRTSPDAPLGSRLATLHRELGKLIREHRPDAISLETVFTNRNLNTAISVGRASGVAILAAAEAGLEVSEYAPTAIKAAVTGDGSAGKDAVAAMVARLLGLEEQPRPADAADALAVALCHLRSARLAAAAGPKRR
ncbi:MAG TPA: crossover junction endodeoxyribonuclease RuvC [Acidimicrobiia bacterium]|nr:crossover junction endodeoxyribonuclease RuvC [Acidimicrobiia bacterium]